MIQGRLSPIQGHNIEASQKQVEPKLNFGHLMTQGYLSLIYVRNIQAFSKASEVETKLWLLYREDDPRAPRPSSRIVASEPCRGQVKPNFGHLINKASYNAKDPK